MTEIVAEISGNHGGVLYNALRLIRAAADAEVDAVKFQCFEPYALAFRRTKNAEVKALAGGDALLDLYKRTHTPKPWFPELVRQANDCGLKWFSSVFDPIDVSFLEALGCPRYKISAFEMLEWDIIKAVRETGKPIVMSVRPTPNVMILHASSYDGLITPLGESIHANAPPSMFAPMVEYHLKLEDVETPDSAFSLTTAELAGMVASIKKARPL